LELRASKPLATLLKPTVLFSRAPKPLAVLPLPLVFMNNASSPKALSKGPLTLLWRAPDPSAVQAAPAHVAGSGNASAVPLAAKTTLTAIPAIAKRVLFAQQFSCSMCDSSFYGNPPFVIIGRV